MVLSGCQILLCGLYNFLSIGYSEIDDQNGKSSAKIEASFTLNLGFVEVILAFLLQ